MKAEFTILFEDDCLIAVDKPSGELSVPGRTIKDSTFTRVKDYYPEAREIHRLDMGTSGVLLFAKNKASQSALHRQFEQRKVHKCYLAVCFGTPQHEQGLISLPLLCDWPNRPKQKVEWFGGKAAQTHYQLHALPRQACSSISELDESLCEKALTSCQEFYDICLAILFPKTGRSHQLRVHLDALGHSILGDELYGSELSQNAAKRLMLHAASLTFLHPQTSQSIQIHADSTFGELAKKITGRALP